MSGSTSSPAIRPLLLAGGRSTRMGSPKHLLELPDGRPLYQHLISVLRAACPEICEVYVSLAQDSQLDATLRVAAEGSPENEQIRIIYDQDENRSAESAGPAAGLLAAHQALPETTWLVLACDYPFVTAESLQHLRSSYTPPVTCFLNDEGFCEPLIGIWSPTALQHLANRVKEGSSGPNRVVKELKGLMIRPPSGHEKLLCDANTQAEWRTAFQELTGESASNSTGHESGAGKI